MKNTDLSSYKILEQINQGGVHIVVNLFDRNYTLTAAEVYDYLENRTLFEAKQHGVEINKWIAWKNFFKNPRCQALTRKKKRCMNSVRDLTIETFDPARQHYCASHKPIIALQELERQQAEFKQTIDPQIHAACQAQVYEIIKENGERLVKLWSRLSRHQKSFEHKDLNRLFDEMVKVYHENFSTEGIC